MLGAENKYLSSFFAFRTSPWFFHVSHLSDFFLLETVGVENSFTALSGCSKQKRTRERPCIIYVYIHICAWWCIYFILYPTGARVRLNLFLQGHHNCSPLLVLTTGRHYWSHHLFQQDDFWKCCTTNCFKTIMFGKVVRPIASTSELL